MKLIIILLTALMSLAPTTMTDGFYDFIVDDIDGNPTALHQFKGKVVLVVNVASKCGYTPQYEGLQKLYDKYRDEGLVILGFPANNFNGQEPGTEEEIKRFCRLNYGVEFPMFSKVSVKGEDQHELFKYLTSLENPDFTGDIKWNFEKFLIDRNGNLVRRFRSAVKPESEEMIAAISKELDS